MVSASVFLDFAASLIRSYSALEAIFNPRPLRATSAEVVRGSRNAAGLFSSAGTASATDRHSEEAFQAAAKSAELRSRSGDNRSFLSMRSPSNSIREGCAAAVQEIHR